MLVKRLTIIALAACLISSLALFGCGTDVEEREYYTELEQLHDREAGILTGSIFDTVTTDRFPDCPQSFYNSWTDLITALKSGRIDFFPSDYANALMSIENTKGITYIKEPLFTQEYAFAFSNRSERGDAIRAQMDAFLAERKASGWLDTILNKWYDELTHGNIEKVNLTGENGTIVVSCSADVPPFCFVRDGEIIGSEVDILNAFCAEYGYSLDIRDMDFSGIIPAVSAGKADFACSCITVSEERKDSVNFSATYADSPIVCIVLNDEADEGFFASLASGFTKTFVVENRWKLIAAGIGTTLLISIAAAIIGTAFGFLFYLFCRRRGKGVNRAFDIVASLIDKTPAVVLLMVFYYIILADASLTGTAICIGAFALSTSLAVYVSLKKAVLGIGRGQTEAAYSLGLTDRQTFFGIILPQAMQTFIDDYEGILAGLVQGTSVVGYVSVQDLTRVSDLIRGRTYDAFFPLIATAILYLILGWLLTVGVHMLSRRFQPALRTEDQIAARFRKPARASRAQSTPAPEERKPLGTELIRAEHLMKHYGKFTPTKDLSFTVNAGDAISVIGPSGTGKSTLLRMLNMLDGPDAGRIFLNGEEITAPKYPLHLARRHVGMVFQQFNLFPHLTIIENVTYAPIRVNGATPADAFAEGMDLLQRVGIADHAFSYPNMLSGGQQQRAAIARTLAMHPEIILFDEPTSALDPTMVEEVKLTLKDLLSEGYTMITVTHDMELAEDLANRVFFLCDGRLHEEGTPQEIFHSPKHDETRAFVKRLRALTIEIDRNRQHFPSLVTELSQFFYRHRIPLELQTKIRSIFEELCFQILLPQAQDEGALISFTMNYSSKEQKAALIVRFKNMEPRIPADLARDEGGCRPITAEEAFDYFDETMAWKIVRGRSMKTVYRYEEDEARGKLTLKLS